MPGPRPSRRRFLLVVAAVGAALAVAGRSDAHHRLGHRGGSPTSTATTATPSQDGLWPDTWPDTWP